MSPSINTAEPIAWTIEQFRQRNVNVERSMFDCDEQALERGILLAGTATVVDVSRLQRSIKAEGKPFQVYEDSVCRPPWLDASFCYVQHDGSVIVSHVAMLDVDDWIGERWQPDFRWMDGGTDEGQFNDYRNVEPPHSLDWDRVRWVGQVLLYGSVPAKRVVTGPLHMIRLAVDEDGTLLDLSWQQLLPDVPIRTWDSAIVVTLSALTFLNCRNVTVVEPHRPRAERRRIERVSTDVRVTEINVFPRGVSVTGKRGDPTMGGVPATTVRGHVAHYGCHGRRGLLFGKIAGEFWIPFHARGSSEHGTVEHSYTLHESEDT